jgi:uncharacterized alpha-E superfamily protein
MLSRVADNLYWFSRYVRRAETTARLLGVGSLLQLDLPRSVRFAWRPMVDTVGAGENEYVLVVQGSSARMTPETKNLPSDCATVGIIDSIQIDHEALELH